MDCAVSDLSRGNAVGVYIAHMQRCTRPWPSPEAHQVGNGDALEVVLAGKGLQLGPPQHVAVCGVDDLRDDPNRLAASQAGQVHRCLCVAWALQHTSLPAASRGFTTAQELQWLRRCTARLHPLGWSVQQCQLPPVKTD